MDLSVTKYIIVYYQNVFFFRSQILKQSISLETDQGRFPDLTEDLTFFKVIKLS